MDIKILDIEEGWNDDFRKPEWVVTFEFDLKGDTYKGVHTYCEGSEYESVNHVSVTLDGVEQYEDGYWDADKREYIPFEGTYLARTIPEDYWTDEFTYAVRAPIEEARERATLEAIAGIKAAGFTYEGEV